MAEPAGRQAVVVRAVRQPAALPLRGVVPTFQPETKGTEDFGRVYAAYGCWFIMLSLAWGWAVVGNRPDAGDGIGALLAAAGAVVITFWPRS